jgi:hypothetical protein
MHGQGDMSSAGYVVRLEAGRYHRSCGLVGQVGRHQCV